MQTPYPQIAYWSWLVLLLVWLPGDFTSKGTFEVARLGLQIAISVLLVVCFVFLFNPALFDLGTPIIRRTAFLGVIAGAQLVRPDRDGR